MESIEKRWLGEAELCVQRINEVPVEFERKLGQAIRKLAPTKAQFKALLEQWDSQNAGLKKVDFRRQLRGQGVTALKLSASNQEIDLLFDSITGGGGGATASAKELLPPMWPFAVQASVPDPRIETLLAEAEEHRAVAKEYRDAIMAMQQTLDAEEQLDGTQGGHAPVIAQIGAILLKRNMKVGEVMASEWRPQSPT